jgi:hypothetical protein
MKGLLIHDVHGFSNYPKLLLKGGKDVFVVGRAIGKHLHFETSKLTWHTKFNTVDKRDSEQRIGLIIRTLKAMAIRFIELQFEGIFGFKPKCII